MGDRERDYYVVRVKNVSVWLLGDRLTLPVG